ncbi:hypothetical protein CBS101457_004680 [Exobasidium rhododendri]|nr:hypothetical protein CBS101457_004680 [Exobasidium rhododendri]
MSSTITSPSGLVSTVTLGGVAEGTTGKADQSLPSSVPKSGRRRESIGGQIRRLASESPTIVAAGGGTGSISFQRSNGQTIPPLISSRSPRLGPSGHNNDAGLGMGSVPSSFGAAAEAMSLSAKSSFGSHSFTTSTGGLVGKPSERSTGHTHFGQECFGPQPGDPTTTTAAPLLHSMLTKENVQKNNRSGAGGDGRRNSFSSVATDDDKSLNSLNQMLHKCEACSKVYRHPSCLVKHRWEHTVYWKEASKFLMSKHQQVQLLEAAAILVGMDTHARSLPEEKALWPAAVSPPSSGLLGSDKINFEKLLAQRSAGKTQSPIANRRESSQSQALQNSKAQGEPTISSPTADPLSLSGQPASLSPLHNFTKLNLGQYSRNKDVGPLRLDESAERNVREESETEDEEEDDDDDDDREEDETEEGDESMTGSTTISTGSPSREAEDGERERYGLGAGGDVFAEMEMEGVE